MKELDHDNLEYEGGPGETARVRVTPHGTTAIVPYTVDGTSLGLGVGGGVIEFNLKNSSGQRTDLQLILDFNALGNYDVTVEGVANCSRDAAAVGGCLHKWKGPPRKIKTFAFFVA
jgi:hypothetical protein